MNKNTPYYVLVFCLLLLIAIFGIKLFSNLFVGQKGKPSFNEIPIGFIEKEEFIDDSGGCQDFTDYGKYKYDSSGLFVNNNRYRKVIGEDLETILSYYDNFHDVMEGFGHLDSFTMNREVIKTGDYYHLEVKNYNEQEKFWNYSLWYFDMETLTLYYFHNNI